MKILTPLKSMNYFGNSKLPDILSTVLICILLSSIQTVFGQFYQGVRQSAVSNAVISARQDLFSAVQNPALFAQNEKIEMLSFYSPSPFGLSELAVFGAGGSFTLAETRFTAAVSSYGYRLYRENTFLLSAGKEFYGISGGLSVQAAHLKIEGYGSSLVPVFSVGLQYNILPSFSLGSSFINLTNASWSNTQDQIGQTALLGVRYQESNFIAVSFSLRNETGYKAEQLAGLELKPSEFLLLLAGMQFASRQYSAGVSFMYMGITADYATIIHPVLGLSHQFALGYSIE